MTGRGILISLIVLVALVLVWFLVKPSEYTEPEPQAAFAELRGRIVPREVTEILLESKEKKDAVLKRAEGGWVLPKLFDYPALSDDVDKLLYDLIGLGEEKLVAQSPESHADYEVGAEKGKRLRLLAGPQKEVANLVVGKSNWEGGSSRCFMRLGDSNDVYSVRPDISGKLKAPWNEDPWSKQWLNKDLVKLDSKKGEEIVKVEVTRRDGETFTLEKIEEEKVVEEPKKEEPAKDEPPKDEATKDEPAKVEATKEEPKKDEAAAKESEKAEPAPKKAETEAPKEPEKPKTIKETKWYLTSAQGKLEPDSSNRSSFVSALDSISGQDAVAPAELPAYGLEPAYLTIKVTTGYTKEESKAEKPRTFEILIGDQVPEEVKEPEKKEEPKAEAAKTEGEAPKVEAPKTEAPKAEGETPKAPSEQTPPPPSSETSSSSADVPPPEPAPAAPEQPAPVLPPVPPAPAPAPPVPTPATPEPAPPPITPAPAEQPKAGEAPKPETPAAAEPPKVEAPKVEEKKPEKKFKTDRYIKLKGDIRFLTIAEWKFKSLDKRPADLLKKEEPKKEEPKPADSVIGPPLPPPGEGAAPPKSEPAPPKAEGPAPGAAPAPVSSAAAPDKVSVRHILIAFKGGGVREATRSKEEAKQKAEELLAEIKKDRSTFADLAKTWSDDPGSKDNGGLYEDADPNSWVPAFRDTAKSLSVGGLSGLVETEYGYHIMERTK